jgi:hypothetical protein
MEGKSRPDCAPLETFCRRGLGGCYTLPPCNARGKHISCLIISSCFTHTGHVTPARL